MSTVQKPRINRNAKNKAKQNPLRKGSGWYLFKNHKNCDLILPKPTSKGVDIIPFNGTWEGDDYYFLLVKSNLAQLIKKISEEIPFSPKEFFKVEELNIKENKTMSEKLILDQAPCVTTSGSVEQYVVNPENTVNPEDLGIVMLDNVKTGKNKKNKINEHKEKEVLLNDSPISGIQILN